MIDPGEGLPLFDGEELVELMEGARVYTVNDYEWSVTLQKTRLTEAEVTKRVSAAVVTVAGAFVLAFSRKYYPDPFTRIGVRVGTLGYALPGSVLAVGVMISLTWIDQRIADGWLPFDLPSLPKDIARVHEVARDHGRDPVAYSTWGAITTAPSRPRTQPTASTRAGATTSSDCARPAAAR